MTINLGVKALLGWVNSIKLSDREIEVDDLQDGTLFLRVIYMLKKQSNPCFSHSTEERFNLIADFVENDCKFSATKGSSISLGNIRDGINLTVEIAKVLLLLVYYDMMNARCTLNMLECDVEREIANLTGSFVMESEDCVYLSNRIDAYLAKRHLPVSREIFDQSSTTSTSNVSTISSLSDEDSPVFHRRKRITFQDMHTVASSSASKSPLQDIMNTPKFQMRVMQRQMIKERDYRDGLERELSGKLSLISQKESHVNQLQYRLDKLKEEQDNQEDATREQINDLETKNNTLQMRLNEILMKNKDLKSTSSLMEHKVDSLTDENGVLSSQMRTVCSQLTIFEAEVGRLTESQASSQEEWQSQTSHLQTELNQATAQKELLTEQIQILQGKISCLEDEISKATEEEVGENMGPVMEREMVETEINDLKNELDSTYSSLKQAEMEIQTKSHQLADYQQEITQQKELLQQQKSQTEEIIQAKDELLDKLQKEITEQRAALHLEIQHLKLQLDQVEQQKTEQTTRLQQHVAACEREIERLKEMKREREDLLHQTEEKVKDLEAKLSAASCLLADKDQQIISLKDKVDVLTDESKIIKEEIQAKEEMLAKIFLEKSNEQEILHDKIRTLTTQVEDLNSSLKQAEQEIQLKQDLLAKTHQDNIEQKEMLQQQVATFEEEVQKVNAEIQVRNEQLVTLRNDSSCQSGLLEGEIKGLKSQVENLNDSLTKSAQQVQEKLSLLDQQEQESSHQKEILQQQLSASEDQVRIMREEIQAKEEQMNMLKNQSSEQSELLQQETGELKKQVESLSCSLTSAEENLQSKENLFVEQQLQNAQHMEALQAQIVASQDDVKRLNVEIHAKEDQLVQLKSETSTHSYLLQQEIEGLNKEIKSMSHSIDIAKDQVQAKADLNTKQEQESTLQIESLKKHSAALEVEVNRLTEEIQTKHVEVDAIKFESCKESEVLQTEIKALRDQVEHLSGSLKTATEQVQDKENLLAEKESEISQGNHKYQNLMETSEEQVRGLREEIQAKEEKLLILRKDGTTHSDMLEQEMTCLKNQLDSTVDSLTKAEEKMQIQVVLLDKQEHEISHQKEILQQQLSASEDRVRSMREEIQAKEEQMNMLRTDGSEQSDSLNQEIQMLKEQVESLSFSLTSVEENLQSKENLFAEQQLQKDQHMEALQTQMVASQDEVKRLNVEIHSREEKLNQLKSETSTQSDLLQQEIEVNRLKENIQTKQGEVNALNIESCKESEVLQTEIQTLRDQVEHLSGSLKTATEQVQDKENLLAQKDSEISQGKDNYQNLMETSEEQVRGLREEILAKEEKLLILRKDGTTHSDMLEQEMTCLKNQLDSTVDSLTKAEEKMQIQVVLLDKQEHEISHQREILQQQLSASEDQVRSMREEIQAKEEQMNMLRTDGYEQSDSLNLEIQSLKEQLEGLSSSLSKVEKDVQSKEDLLAQREDEIQKLKECRSEMENLLLRTEQRIEILQTELSAVNALVADKDQLLSSLREEVAVQANQLQKAREEAEANERILAEIRVESSKQSDVLQCDIQGLKGEVKNISFELSTKEQMLLKTQQESSQQIDLLQQQLISVNLELNQHKDTHSANLRLREGVEELQVATLREKEALVQERQELLARIHQAEIDQKALEEQLKAMGFEKERLDQAKQATEKENATSRKLESVLQHELEMLKMEKEKLLKDSEKAEEIEVLKRGLQEQLSAKSEAVEHYKAQMDKAVNHYNGKKQLLQECQQVVTELKHSLGIKECEVKTVTMENKLLQRDLGKAQTNEKNLLDMVASLKAQLTFADHNLQLHNKVHGKKGGATELSYLDIHDAHSSIQTRVKRTESSDSLDQSSLEDSLNNTRKLSGPDESSTPFVRSSERLAAKRRGLQAESLETLYFTPIANRQMNRTSTENRIEPDSTRKNPSSSVRRRRTTQVINLTLTKKTPGGGEGDETFYSLASARSHPNLSRAPAAKPVSMELFGTPARMAAATSDQLIGLPGYRRSTIHSQTSSTFCVGSENEPEGAPDDWLRIAELQSRNRTCLPHLKSSYPVESEAHQGSVFIFTDEEVRTGDPSDTIRRASMMPGQLQDSLVSHRHSLMTGQSGAAASTRSHRLSLMPGQLPSNSVSSSHIRSPQGTKRSSSTLSVHQISPEKRVKASCFPRPLTPKNKNVISGSSSSQLRAVLSPAERRQSMMFTVDNTPNKSNNYLKRGLNKLRTSTSNPSGASNSGVGRAGRAGNFKSPQVTIKGRKKSPQATSKIGKSPGLTASARKLLNFKLRFIQCEPGLTEQQVTEGDLLDFVDKIVEILGQDQALMHTISNLETISKTTEAEDLRNLCKRAFIRFHLKQQFIRKHQIIREGVVRAGRWNPLDTIYVEPQISTRCHGGVDPSHEFRPHPASPRQLPSPDTFVHANELFRLQIDDNKPVRTVLTSGIPGIGMSVSVGKFALDWAEQRANKDLQFVIKLSFNTFWLLRKNLTPSSQKMSIMEVIEHCHSECKDMTFLEEEDCRFLVIMDSFDCYQARLDWKHAPVINDNNMKAHPDVLIVNIIRGTLLRGACIWILGRRGAVSRIPSDLIDVDTEIQGFSDEMKDDYLTRRFSDATLARNIVSHHKRLPTLSILARQPFVCWMVATVFERCYRYQGYGVHPPRLTPFYVNILIVQTNRKLQFYYGKREHELKWSSEDKSLLTKMGRMAFKMMERNTSVFFEEDVKQSGLELTEVTVWSGLCTELPSAESDGRRTFCFLHVTFQEFMAALYVFTKFYEESKNVLDPGVSHFPKIHIRSRSHAKSAAQLVQSALGRTFSSALGDYDMFLRFLCGLLSQHCHKSLLSGFLFPHNAPMVGGLDEVQRLLEQTIDHHPGDRKENLKECLREMIQEDE
ncbi:nuclear mitotic apparatus protein 1 [Limanda limanda]|uniref:nuclear mitotic apparatus protein 1 n=1 Tax=Limanda limanda TaxID=27771 RepID=UPI0029C679FF|nr:nuclear mitotic apparatus protein 1 [Limanda limanda]